MLCQPLRTFLIDEIPDLKIPIGFENSYRNSYIENGEKNSFWKKNSYRNSYRIGK
jgi:hypothetical protein